MMAYHFSLMVGKPLAVMAFMLLSGLGSSSIHAQNIIDLMPPGWKQEELEKGYGGRTFNAPDGITVAEVDHINDGDGLAKEAESARDYLRPSGGDVVRKVDAKLIPGTSSYAAGGTWQDQDTGVKTMGIAMARLHPSGRTWVCSFRTRTAAQMPSGMTQWLKICMDAADNGYFVYEDDRKAAAARAKIASIPIKSGAGRPIEATLLEVFYISGVGGMILPDYKPIVLFKDGTAIRDFELPVAEIDVAQFVKAQPNDVTRWQRTAKGYSVQWPDDNEPTVIEFTAERPKTFPVGHRLDDYWKRLGGGGNSAMGGDITIAVSDGYRFLSDGRFSTNRAFSGSTPGVFTGSTGENGGTYTLNGNALVLFHSNGTVKRLSIYYGGAIHDPVLWLAGESYTN